MIRIRFLVAAASAVSAAFAPIAARAQSRPSQSVPTRSEAIADVRYNVTFKALQGVERALDVAMTFTVAGREPVLLSLPVWTPGAYEVSDYARYVSQFQATSAGRPLRWDKSDPDSWRIFTDGPGEVAVTFRFRADTLDNAGSFARDRFALFNGTNIFLYPAGRSLDFPSTVTVTTEDSWRVTTGMTPAGPRSWTASSYHELVDHPFFVGRFDVDSARIAGAWFHLSTYPAGSVSAERRVRLLAQLGRAIPAEVAVFGEAPWRRYEVMQIADSGFGGMSALEHENSNVGIIGADLLDEDFVPSVYAHEIFHSFNVKRLRPADMWPYRYDTWQPTPWLWVSEGITDYYADLALVRGGVIGESGFREATQRKIDHVEQTAPVALDDASLQTWLHMTDGTQDIYYDKGSLAGLALDILIRDATDNADGLDDVMRDLWTHVYRAGRGFTAEEWWSAVSRAANGARFTAFDSAYVDGRAPYPWADWLPRAGWRLRADTLHEPRLGVSLGTDSAGLRVTVVDPTGVAAAAGIQTGDVITAIGGIPTTDPSWQLWRQHYARQEGAPLPIAIRRDGRAMTVTARVHLVVVIQQALEVDPNASPKAKRIRDGILKGETAKPGAP